MMTMCRSWEFMAFPRVPRSVVDSSCRENLLERLPIVRVPAGRQVLGVPGGEAGMVKDDPGPRVQIQQLEAHERVDATVPVSNPPRLDNQLVRYQFDVPAHDVAPEQDEATSLMRADLGRLRSLRQLFHDPARPRHLVELAGVGQRLIDALASGGERRLPMYGLCRTGNLPGRCSPTRPARPRKPAHGDGAAGQDLPPIRGAHTPAGHR